MSRLTDLTFPPDLLERAGRGDLVAQERLYRELSPPVFALIRRLVGDWATAEDLFQDSLMLVFRDLPQFRGEAPFGVWVRRIAVSRCFMHLRSPWQRARRALSDLAYGDDAADDAVFGLREASADSGDQIDLSRALAQLKPVARTVLWLHDVEGYTHEEIARGYGRTVSFSKSQLARAHEALQPLLAGTEDMPCKTLEPLNRASRSLT
ncbi:MAG TPA: RNA polymerase sigma factor [Steroidobacteraceae bacterium]|jgi:RNA polymerase sigma-70 factor (ECF subfamily)|nr:RNA polymerase sigma factor [Steroidobacteraceae bacterium]